MEMMLTTGDTEKALVIAGCVNQEGCWIEATDDVSGF
jgi:hypothetical protein